MNKNMLETYEKIKRLRDVCAAKNEPLSRHTTFRIGGPADILVVPKTIDALRGLISMSANVPMRIIGNGSDILVTDKGIRGIVIKLANGLNSVEIRGNRVKAGSGVLLSRLIAKTAKEGLSGLEFCAGIPGTLGGAIMTNMGSYGRSISGLVEKVILMNRSGREIVIDKRDIDFAYRRARIARGSGLIIEVVLKLRRGHSKLIQKRVKKYLIKKKATQPIAVPSAGCIFKNPKGLFAGKLIQDAECKGLRVGGAEVSKTHANYIINLGDATSDDVLKLAGKVRKRVKDKFGVSLKYEIIDSNHLSMLS